MKNGFNIAISITATQQKGPFKYSGTRLADMPHVQLYDSIGTIMETLQKAVKLEVAQHPSGEWASIWLTDEKGNEVLIEENDHTGKVSIRTWSPWIDNGRNRAVVRNDALPQFLEQAQELKEAILSFRENIHEDSNWCQEDHQWRLSQKEVA